MSSQYLVIINKHTGEQYRDGLHAVQFDSKQTAEAKLGSLGGHVQENGWTTMTNEEAIEFYEARIEAYTLRQLQEAAFS